MLTQMEKTLSIPGEAYDNSNSILEKEVVVVQTLKRTIDLQYYLLQPTRQPLQMIIVLAKITNTHQVRKISLNYQQQHMVVFQQILR